MSADVNLMIEEFYKVFYETEELMLKQGIKCLTTTELHVIEAIGTLSLTMNELSEKLGITMGTATVAVNKLNEKGFIDRERSSSDRRKVYVTLSSKGREALKYHELFHQNLITNITKDLHNDELESFTKIFSKILTNLHKQLENVKPDILSNYPEGSKVKVIEVKGSKAAKSFYTENAIITNCLVDIVTNNNNNISIKVNNKIIELDNIDCKNLIAIIAE